MKARKKVKILAWEKMVVLHQMSVATLSSKAMGNGGRFDRVCFDDDERDVLQKVTTRPNFRRYEKHKIN